MNLDVLIEIMNLIGDVAFAVSGAMTAIEKKMDIFGVCMLGIFTVIGINVAQGQLKDADAFIMIVVGVITGVGGGVLRDVFNGSIPYIFKKHVYALASAVGAIAYVVLDDFVGVVWATLLCAVLVIVIRLLATYYRWNLPRIQEMEEDIGSHTEP